MARFAPGNLGGLMQQAGASIGNLGQAVFAIEAEEQFRTGRLALVSSLEEFKQSLWQDPDYGTPGQNDGYVGKFQEFMQGTKGKPGAVGAAIGGLGNAVARDKLSQYAQQLELEQGAEIEELQFKKWAEGTVAKTGKRVSTLLDNGTMPAAAKLTGAYDEYAYLRDHNLITAEEAQERMDSAAQIAIERDIFERAKTTYDQKGLSAAIQAISGDATTYTAGGASYSGGETARKLAAARMEQYDSAIQETENSRMEQAFANYGLVAEGAKTEGDFLTREMIAGSKLNFQGKMYWNNQLDAYLRQRAGDDSADKRKAYAYLNTLTMIANAVNASGSSFTTRPEIWLPDGTSRTLASPTEAKNLYKQVKREGMGVLYAMEGTGAKLADLDELLDGPTNSASFIRDQILKDPKIAVADKNSILEGIDEIAKVHPDWGTDDWNKYYDLNKKGSVYGHAFGDRFGSWSLLGGKDQDSFTKAAWAGELKGSVGGNPGSYRFIAPRAREAGQEWAAVAENTIRTIKARVEPGKSWQAGKDYKTNLTEDRSGRVTFEIDATDPATGNGEVYTVVPGGEHLSTAILRETIKGQKLTYEICTDFEKGIFRPAEKRADGQGWDVAATEKAKDAQAEAAARAKTSAEQTSRLKEASSQPGAARAAQAAGDQSMKEGYIRDLQQSSGVPKLFIERAEKLISEGKLTLEDVLQNTSDMSSGQKAFRKARGLQ